MASASRTCPDCRARAQRERDVAIDMATEALEELLNKPTDAERRALRKKHGDAEAYLVRKGFAVTLDDGHVRLTTQGRRALACARLLPGKNAAQQPRSIGRACLGLSHLGLMVWRNEGFCLTSRGERMAALVRGGQAS